MCGIIAVVRRRSTRSAPSSAELISLLDGAAATLGGPAAAGDLGAAISGVAERVEAVDRLLRGTPGIVALLADQGLAFAFL